MSSCGWRPTPPAARPTFQEHPGQGLIQDHPLQPFNADCFRGSRPSFDRGQLDIARTFRQREEEVVAPFHSGTIDPPDEVQSADLELHELIRVLKDPWSAWLGSLKVELPRTADDPFALDREPVATPVGLNRWQIQREVIDAELDARTAFLTERLAADRLLPLRQPRRRHGWRERAGRGGTCAVRGAGGGRAAAAAPPGVPRGTPAGRRQRHRHGHGRRQPARVDHARRAAETTAASTRCLDPRDLCGRLRNALRHARGLEGRRGREGRLHAADLHRVGPRRVRRPSSPVPGGAAPAVAIRAEDQFRDLRRGPARQGCGGPGP